MNRNEAVIVAIDTRGEAFVPVDLQFSDFHAGAKNLLLQCQLK
jgi:hypothetical protein